MPHLQSDNREGRNETGKEAGAGGREFSISLIERKNLEDAGHLQSPSQSGIASPASTPAATGGSLSSIWIPASACLHELTRSSHDSYGGTWLGKLLSSNVSPLGGGLPQC